MRKTGRFGSEAYEGGEAGGANVYPYIYFVTTDHEDVNYYESPITLLSRYNECDSRKNG